MRYLVSFALLCLALSVTSPAFAQQHVTIRDAAGNVLVAGYETVDPVSVAVTPQSASINSGAVQQFTAAVANSLNPGVAWSASLGAIDGNGNFSLTTSEDTQAVITAASLADPSKVASATVSVKALFDGPAELPRVRVNSAMAATPAPGTVVQVIPGGLQSAINAANCGDTLELQAGISYQGSFTLPAKPCDDQHWIVIRSNAPDSALPAEGSRFLPCYAGVASLPGRPAFSCPAGVESVAATVISKNSAAPFAMLNGANHYRLGPGLETTRTSGTGISYGLIALATAGSTANHIVIDRDWIHGTAQDDTMRGVMLSGVTYAAVIDSYLNDFHCAAAIGTCVDSQAIAGGTGPAVQGAWEIHNNFLEAAAENILFGGTNGNSATPADIVIRHNHLFKPLTWMPGQPGFVGATNTDLSKCSSTPGFCPFVVKNLFELKNSQRVLFEANILENVWGGFSQNGSCILLQGLNPVPAAGAAVYSQISLESLTLRYNSCQHTNFGFAITNPTLSGIVVEPVSDVSIHDNTFDDIDSAYANGVTPLGATMWQMSGAHPIVNVTINHNTEIAATPPRFEAILGGPLATPSTGFVFTNNIVVTPPGLVVLDGSGSSCASTGNTNLLRLTNCFGSTMQFANNVLIGATNTWPAGNFFPANPAAVGFANFANGNGGDYSLASSSPYKHQGTDGRDPGADAAALSAAIAGVE